MRRVAELLPPDLSLPERPKPTPTTELSRAAEVLWGPAGSYLYAAYRCLRATYFPDIPAELPLVIGLTAYGHCIGLTRHPWPQTARISLAPGVFATGEGMVDDVLLHEMLHVHLAEAGLDPKHAGEPWYTAVRRLSPAVLGQPLDVERSKRRSMRIANPAYGLPGEPKTLVRKQAPEGDAGLHRRVATWPHSFRPSCYHWGDPIALPTY